jgi:hypothetical protein
MFNDHAYQHVTSLGDRRTGNLLSWLVIFCFIFFWFLLLEGGEIPSLVVYSKSFFFSTGKVVFCFFPWE